MEQNGGGAAASPEDQQAAVDRILERVSAELPDHSATIVGRLADVVLLVSEDEDEEITVALAKSHDEALLEIGDIEPSGQVVSELRTRLARRPPTDLPVIVILAGGSIFYRTIICVPGHRMGSA